MHVKNVRLSVCFIAFIENRNRVWKRSKFQPDLKLLEKPTREAKFERTKLKPAPVEAMYAFGASVIWACPTPTGQDLEASSWPE